MDPLPYILAGCFLFFIIGLLVAIANAAAQREAAAALKLAEKDHLESLNVLKQDPHNPDARERTLAKGRVYATRARSGAGVNLFDEVALMNDINAACAWGWK